jgi:S1-C subfamily serine protease
MSDDHALDTENECGRVNVWEGNMSPYRSGLDKLLCGRALTLGIFALTLTFHAYTAHAASSVRVLATLPQAGGAITHHMSGDALPVGAKYRIVVSPDSSNSLTVDTRSESGKGDRLFSSDKVTANRSIVLPAGEGWYPLPPTSGEFRVVVTHGDEIIEHVIRSIDSSPRPGAPAVDDWLNQSTGDSRLTSTSALGDDPSDVYERATVYRSAALKLALAKEPPSVFRGGPGATIFRTAAPSVVLIKTDKGIGSGIVLSKRGEVLTNWHVVDGGKFIAILTKPPAGQHMDPGEVYDATLVKYDQVADLALIQFQHAPPNLVPLRISDDRELETGSTVHAIGHPGEQQWTYTQGVISQVRTDFKWKGNNDLQHTATVIQTQTPINPGSSGGPLLDDYVAVIGVNAFFIPDKQGLNYAISFDEIKRFLARSGNRDGIKPPPSQPLPEPKQCSARQFPPTVDSITKKKVVPFDTMCRGRPNAWRVGDPPEYLIFDRVGDGKIDFKIVYRFSSDVDLWIMYGMRDEIPTMFGYDYGRKGKPDRWVTVNPPHQ